MKIHKIIPSISSGWWDTPPKDKFNHALECPNTFETRRYTMKGTLTRWADLLKKGITIDNTEEI